MLSELDALPSIQLGDFVLRFELDELTDFGKEVAKRELRESPENRENGVKELRKLLQQGESDGSSHLSFKFGDEKITKLPSSSIRSSKSPSQALITVSALTRA